MSELTIKIKGSIEVKSIISKLQRVVNELSATKKDMGIYRYNRRLKIDAVGGFTHPEGREIMTKTYPIVKKFEEDIKLLEGREMMLKELIKDFMGVVSENILDHMA